MQYLVTETDTFIDLTRAEADISWAQIFDKEDDAEKYARGLSREYIVGIHKFIDDKYAGLITVVWDGTLFDSR